MSAEYEILDSGDGRKLERIGPHLLDRQAPQAFWTKRLPETAWREADAVHHRSEKGGGHWEFRKEIPATWTISLEGLTVQMKPTPFGHVGLFAEQTAQWRWMRERIAARVATGATPRVLNLFAYTGLASLTAAAAGADVCHVDASKSVVDWARENAKLSGLEDRPVRWIVDDCLAFAGRDVRRGRKYDAIVLDPPTYGRGTRKEAWRIETDLPRLLRSCAQLLTADPLFIVLSCHTPGWTPIALENVLGDAVDLSGFELDGGEMSIPQKDQRILPSGYVLRAVGRG
ncbi:MAG: SAM-dependent methyltransferase [Planctomycetes bacterium]|nr:SAM-dependent methyltransferase [Planctomycetota bacterium]